VDLSPAQLEIAFKRARTTLKFFPKIAELRELAGAGADEIGDVQAEAAWQDGNAYLGKWGVERIPLYSNGKWTQAPPLDPRTDYALKAIGGLWALNQVTSESRPFMKRAFIEAYKQAPLAMSLAPLLEEAFGEKRLLGQVKQLAADKSMNRREPGVRENKIESADC
jgi:hypothetical protein